MEELKQKEEAIIFLGDGIDVYKEKILGVLENRASFAPDFFKLQRASALATVASDYFIRGEMIDASEFVPMYLRKSQAEREKEERENCKG